MNTIARPIVDDAPAWYPSFWIQAPGDDLISVLCQNQQALERTLSFIKPEQLDFTYSKQKWTLKQVLIHLADEERYYSYKAFCCSRGSKVFLEVPMEDHYLEDFNASNRSLPDIKEELIAVRAATITLFRSMTTAMLDQRDNSREEVYSARSLRWFIAGHSNHHLNVIHNKYLNNKN